MSSGLTVRRRLIRGAIVLGAVFAVFRFVLLPVRLQGVSMLPTFHDGSLNFANRFAYVGRTPARGDIVAIRMAGLSVLYVKRIVALPGERIEIRDGLVLVNDRPLDEPFVVYRAPWNLAPSSLGEDEYFVIGDNRGMDMDDHELGRVERDRLVGRLLL